MIRRSPAGADRPEGIAPFRFPKTAERHVATNPQPSNQTLPCFYL
jgi:hypothetical protein